MGGSSCSLDADLKLQFPNVDPHFSGSITQAEKDPRFVAERCV